MPVTLEPSAPQKLESTEFKLEPRGTVFPSPVTWRDQILYFLMPDRYSDGKEDQRSLFNRANPNEYRTQNKGEWMHGGKKFQIQEGSIKGIRSKLGYLQKLGVTTLWIGPIWKQRHDLETYHGYGIQNFLEVDPHFGSRQDLRDLIDAAHAKGMYVLLDIIYNHSGNNWFYNENGGAAAMVPYRFQPPHPFEGWRSASGNCVPNINTPDDGVWPMEFQNISWYNRAGKINNWDPKPWEDRLHPDTEFRRGDFFDLKDLNLSNSEVLSALIQVYEYWIALTDCDGFRIDTVKHVPWEASRNFCGAIHEYAESIGKENFLLLGEVTGGADMCKDYLEIFGHNVDAALDIDVPPKRLAGMVKGFTDPIEFFNQFKGSEQQVLGSHREAGRYHVSILDDHDMVGRGKHRFAAKNSIPHCFQQVAHAVGVQLTTLGIPCIYYGTEQAFDGTQDRHDPSIESGFENLDRYIRESMFGGTFGAFETSGCHFFDENHPTYLRIAAIARVRNNNDQIGKALRRGRQYMRETSIHGSSFSSPRPGELVAWSRMLYNQEVLIVLNTNGVQNRAADIIIHQPFHPPGSTMTFHYRDDWSDAQLRKPPHNQTVPVYHSSDGKATVHIDLPPAGMAILA